MSHTVPDVEHTRRRPCCSALLGPAIGGAVVAAVVALARAALDGHLREPLPSLLEEILVIRPAGSEAAARAAAAFAVAGERLLPLRHTPVMGFNTWNAFGCNISEQLILTIAAAITQRGLQEVGYTYIGIDDCWQADERAADGSLRAHPLRFPRGIRALADDLHAAGLKLGLYSDYGLRTCAGLPGSYGHYEQDAATFAAWGVDLLKFDRCAPTVEQDRRPARYFRQMGVALRATGRPILYSLCNWGRADVDEGHPWMWAPGMAHMWRTTTDIFPWYGRVYAILQENAALAPYARPGAFNDPDMLEVGVDGHLLNVAAFPRAALTAAESSLHFSMWAMLAAPLLIGADVRAAPDWVIRVLGNREVVAVSQDGAASQARCVSDEERGTFVTLPLVPAAFWGRVRTCFGRCRKVQVWVRPLANGSAAVAMLNLGDQLSATRASFEPETIEIDGGTLERVGGVRLGAGPHCVRDAVRRVNGEVVPAGTAAATFVLRRRQIAPRAHELLVLRPCECSSDERDDART